LIGYQEAVGTNKSSG